MTIVWTKLVAAVALTTVAWTAGERPDPAFGDPPDPAAFLRALAGDWVVETEATLGPGQEPFRTEAREAARLVGGWLVAESHGTNALGRPYTAILTLGYDPHAERFVATWIDSMQSHLWSYTGTLNEPGTVLTLETEGPIMGNPANRTRYREVLELVDADRKVMRSSILGPDGQWFEFARAESRRQ